jgi:peptidoglycan hydrolase CwlO-like protein
MGIETIITAVALMCTAFGSFWGGRRTGGERSVNIAATTVDMLQDQVDLLNQRIDERDSKIAELQAKMEILEALVTQKAEVEEVKVAVAGVRSVVDQIAAKVGA